MTIRDNIAEILNEWGYESERPHGEIVEEILSLLIKEIEDKKKGKQGCVGFIEDDGEFNQALDLIISHLKGER